MKSPFPGMDPYLEMRWRDVHSRLMVYASDQLNEQLPPDLQALVEESLDIAVDDQHFRTVYADVRVVEESAARPTLPEDSGAGVAVAEPFVVEIGDEGTGDIPKHRHIEIVDHSAGGRLVTAIEVLSPTNKIGQAGRESYVRKRREYFEAGVNLVEIDLIRQGEFILAVPQEEVPERIQPPYLICVRRASFPQRAELYPAPLREPLPNIPIPLRPTDTDVILQLQPLIDECYRRGRHEKTNYADEPIPRLSREDTQWADRLLREKGFR